MLILSPPTVPPIRLGRNLAQFNPAPLFTNEIAPALWEVAVEYGIDPVVMIAQSGKETGWGRFGRAVLPTFCNPCGLKIRDPKLAGDQESTLAHAQFASWIIGAHAHAQHLCAYLQAKLFDFPIVDPRWQWVYGNPRYPAIHDVERLGNGYWAPSPSYGTEIAADVSKLWA